MVSVLRNAEPTKSTIHLPNHAVVCRVLEESTELAKSAHQDLLPLLMAMPALPAKLMRSSSMANVDASKDTLITQLKSVLFAPAFLMLSLSMEFALFALEI